MKVQERNTWRGSATAMLWYIGDEWTTLLAGPYKRYHDAWHALIPPRSRRAEHVAIRARALAFENHFLACYAAYMDTTLHYSSSPLSNGN